MTDLAADLPPVRRAWPIAALRVLIEPSQVASSGVTRPAATIPGSFSAVIRCSLRLLATPSQMIRPKIGTIHKKYTPKYAPMPSSDEPFHSPCMITAPT